MKGLSAGALTDCTDALTDEGRRRVATSKTRRGEAVCSGQAATVARRCSSRLVSREPNTNAWNVEIHGNVVLADFFWPQPLPSPSFVSLAPSPSLPPDSCFTSTGSK